MRKISIAGKSIALALMLAGCAGKTGLTDCGDYWVDTSVTSLNQDDRVRYLVIHYTAVDDRESLALLTHGAGSAHYLVSSLPPVVNGKPVARLLVPEDKRAWHAGISDWNGRSNLNDTSIGIEIVNTGFTESAAGKRWYPYAPEQVELVARLAKDIIQRYRIKPDNVVAHSDIAPLRKSDPGPLFPWAQLAERGIGAWPDKNAVDKYLAGRAPDAQAPVADIQRALGRYGYRLPQHGKADEETTRVISAFQMHFRPGDISGRADAQTEAIALALLEKYRT